MAFNTEERDALLALKGVGPTVIRRLEEAGFHSLASLANYRADELCTMIGQMLGSRCWQNSPLARQGMQAISELAKARSAR